jgi:pimeloyl-ACP methyl ester carboxylesterase
LRDLAVALDVDQIDVVAGSAEAVVALTAVRRHPGLVRTLTLFDPQPVGVNEVQGLPQSADAQLERYEAVCVAQSSVCRAGPPLAEALEQIRRQVTDAPVTVATSTSDGGPVSVVVDGERLIRTLYLAMQDNAALPLIAPSIRTGNVSVAAEYLLLVTEYPGVEPEVWTIVNQCTRAPELSAAELEAEAEQATTWRAIVPVDLAERCLAWGLSPAPELRNQVASDVPTLIALGGLGRAVDPPWLPRLSSLSRKTELVFPNEAYASGLSGGGCLLEVRKQFLRDPTATLDTAWCTEQDPPIAFVE